MPGGKPRGAARALRYLLTRGLLLAALAVAFHGWSAARFLARPFPPFAEPPPPGCVEWRLSTADGETLGAWHFPAPGTGPTVVVLHGWGGSRSSFHAAAEFWRGRGCGALLVSLRGHGDSTGARHDLGFRCAADVIAAVESLERHCPGGRILVQGNSMGAAAAIFAAPALAGRVAGYLLESPYQDLRTALEHRAEALAPALLAPLAKLCVRVAAPWAAPNLAEISPLAAIRRLPAETPVHLVTGGADRQARPSEAVALQAAAPHVRLTILPKSAHEPLMNAEPAGYDAAVAAWLAACAVPP